MLHFGEILVVCFFVWRYGCEIPYWVVLWLKIVAGSFGRNVTVKGHNAYGRGSAIILMFYIKSFQENFIVDPVVRDASVTPARTDDTFCRMGLQRSQQMIPHSVGIATMARMGVRLVVVGALRVYACSDIQTTTRLKPVMEIQKHEWR